MTQMAGKASYIPMKSPGTLDEADEVGVVATSRSVLRMLDIG